MSSALLIVKEPDSVLRKKAQPVKISEITGPKIQELISDMKETLKHTPDGVGLAAPQIGRALQIFIASEEAEAIDRFEKGVRKKKPEFSEAIEGNEPASKPYGEHEWKYYVFINPSVKNVSKKKLDRAEGCLSVPGKFGNVLRQEKITVEAYNEAGEKFIRGASKFFARVLQHELDHLHGTLFIDKAKKVFEIMPEKNNE